MNVVRSRGTQRQPKIPEGTCLQEEAVKPQGTAGGPSVPPAQTKGSSREEHGDALLEQMLARENLLAALRRVEQNGGAPGVDGVTTKDLRDYLRQHWERIREELLAETYQPMPVRPVEIPKPGGGVRVLGIPACIDRLLQQALLQVLTPLFDPTFSPRSHGFRPGRRAHDAVRQVRQYVRDGHRWVVDLDLEKFFGAPG